MHNDNQRESRNRDAFDALRSNIDAAKRTMTDEGKNSLVAFDIVEALLLDFEKRLIAIETEIRDFIHQARPTQDLSNDNLNMKR